MVGQIVGGLSALALLAASQAWSGAIPALLAVIVGVLVTGGFHEDGLADTADGLGGGQDPARRLEIMKDSQVGAYGVLALGLTLAVKIVALAELDPLIAALGLVAAHGGARAAAVLVMRVSSYAGQVDAAKWKPVPDGVGNWEAAIALITAAWPMVFLGDQSLVLGLVIGAALALAVSLLARRLLGGYTGDVLGAVEQVFEAGFLLGLAAWL
jgi:adenosylcobinamide-GDP ribazoletransferase